jgi:hypothetical protein
MIADECEEKPGTPISSKLVGGFKHVFPFHIWDIYIILPIDEVIFFKMVIAPPTRK